MEDAPYIVRIEVRGLWEARWLAERAMETAARRAWGQPESVTIHRAKPSADQRRAPSEVMEWLRGYLGTRAVPVEELRAAGAMRGYTHSRLERAKRRLGVVAARQGFGANGHWYWYLPEGLDLAPDDGPTIKKSSELAPRAASRVKKNRRR